MEDLDCFEAQRIERTFVEKQEKKGCIPNVICIYIYIYIYIERERERERERFNKRFYYI
jgi:hypothetical protein